MRAASGRAFGRIVRAFELRLDLVWMALFAGLILVSPVAGQGAPASSTAAWRRSDGQPCHLLNMRIEAGYHGDDWLPKSIEVRTDVRVVFKTLHKRNTFRYTEFERVS